MCKQKFMKKIQKFMQFSINVTFMGCLGSRSTIMMIDSFACFILSYLAIHKIEVHLSLYVQKWLMPLLGTRRSYHSKTKISSYLYQLTSSLIVFLDSGEEYSFIFLRSFSWLVQPALPTFCIFSPFFPFQPTCLTCFF